ncbi:MAG TPA: hypothetical protein VGQ46_09030, partial [Thermoanaerobaculia bacterium]|nr:hypothetical protein [Thermoanaerobaculia bacterium]
MHLTNLVGAAGVIQDALRRRGFTRVDVSHDPDVPRFFEWYLTWHEVTFSRRQQTLSEGRPPPGVQKLRLFVFPVARSGTAELFLCYPVETELRK